MLADFAIGVHRNVIFFENTTVSGRHFSVYESGILIRDVLVAEAGLPDSVTLTPGTYDIHVHSYNAVSSAFGVYPKDYITIIPINKELNPLDIQQISHQAKLRTEWVVPPNFCSRDFHSGVSSISKVGKHVTFLIGPTLSSYYECYDICFGTNVMFRVWDSFVNTNGGVVVQYVGDPKILTIEAWNRTSGSPATPINFNWVISYAGS